MPRSFIRHEREPREVFRAKVYAPWWTDPYWWIVGSSIEKMVMAELVRRGIYFIYRNQVNDLGGFVNPSWEADFYLPQHRVWIEVQGSYFHSLPNQIEADSMRYAAIEMAGWTPVFLWEFDIRTRLVDLLDEYPVLRVARVQAEAAARDKYGTTPGVGGKWKLGGGDKPLVDQLVGLRKALAGRTKPPQYQYRRRTPGVRMPK